MPGPGPISLLRHTEAPEAAPVDRDYLSTQAERCRRLAATIGDSVTVTTLVELAEEYDERAQRAAGD